MKALGVREFTDAAQGRRSLSDAVAAAQIATRHYAKRQATWFRNQTPHWPRISELEPQAQWRSLQTLRQCA
jgi:tRNA dimethylallyltransferase